jgi:hypothetical protein
LNEVVKNFSSRRSDFKLPDVVQLAKQKNPAMAKRVIIFS